MYRDFETQQRLRSQIIISKHLVWKIEHDEETNDFKSKHND